MTAWTDATGINFFETNGVAQITFDDNATGAYENDVFSNGITTSATINIGTAWIAGDGQNLNSYSFQTYIHEIGHALGLGHAGNYNGSATYGVDNQYTNDSWQATVMSYFSQTDNTSMANSFAYIMTPMMADLIAVGAMYGATTTAHLGATIYGFGTNTGNAVYNAALNPGVSYTILDSGGVDTMNYSGFSQAQLINLYSETFSNIGGLVGNVGIARNTIIENAIGGSGNDTIFGNQVGNFLNGAAGYDYIDGGAGNDTVDYSGATGASYIELYLNRAYNDGYGFYDSLFNVESVYGGSFGDTIVADAEPIP